MGYIDDTNLPYLWGKIKKLCETIGESVSGSYYVTPEQFGAVGDGVTDDTEAVANAIESGSPIICTGKYLLTYEIVTSSNIDITGGTFICNGGKIYTHDNDYIAVNGCTVDCTDGGGIYGSTYGFIHAKNIKRIQFRNITVSNLPYLYKNDFTATNDDTMFISNMMTFENIFATDCVVVIYVSFCKDVAIKNVISISSESASSPTRELFYIAGGIKNLVVDNVYSNYSSRFFFHFNHLGNTPEIDKTLDINKIEHFILSNSNFDYPVPIIHLGMYIESIEVKNTHGTSCVFKSTAEAICNYLKATDSDFCVHSGESAGSINGIYYYNCDLKGSIWSQVIPIEIQIESCRLVSDDAYVLFAIVSQNGKLIIKNSILKSIVDTKLQGIQIATGSKLLFENNHVEASQINRMIHNISADDVLICRNNSIVCDSIALFMNNTPVTGIVTGNYVNYISQDGSGSGGLTESQVNNLIDAKLTGVETLLGGGF